MGTNVTHRTKAVSVKMSQRLFNDFVELASAKDLLPSTMAYLIIRQYIEKQLGTGYDAALDELL